MITVYYGATGRFLEGFCMNANCPAWLRRARALRGKMLLSQEAGASEMCELRCLQLNCPPVIACLAA